MVTTMFLDQGSWQLVSGLTFGLHSLHTGPFLLYDGLPLRDVAEVGQLMELSSRNQLALSHCCHGRDQTDGD